MDGECKAHSALVDRDGRCFLFVPIPIPAVEYRHGEA